MRLSIREMSNHDIGHIVSYFVDADDQYLLDMGADKSKLPTREKWTEFLEKQITLPFKDRSYYYVIWMVDDTAVGHSNINNIEFGVSATMHLHMWKSSQRQQGLGRQFLKLCIPRYFENFELQTLICEPYAANPAPNHTLPKAGFRFIREYETIPGPINLKQFVRRFEMTREQFLEMYPTS